MIPPDRKIVVEKSAALVAVRISMSLSRVKRNSYAAPTSHRLAAHDRHWILRGESSPRLLLVSKYLLSGPSLKF
jgi:hypothetical protein